MPNNAYRVLLLVIAVAFIATACMRPTEDLVQEVPTQTSEDKAPTQTSEDKAPTATPETAKPVEEPVQVECLKVGLSQPGGELDSLDPAWVVNSGVAALHNAVYDRLLSYDSDFIVRPELAVSWEVSQDGKEWTFHLRPGVRFHDGRELTSADVVWTYRRLVDPEVGAEAMANLGTFLTPESIVAMDDYTVKFVTEEPVVELPLFITTKNTWIVPEGATHDDLDRNAVGTGAFIPIDFEPGKQPQRFEANPNYWQPGLPKSQCLEFYGMEDATARYEALRSAKIDIADLVPPVIALELEQDPDITILTTGPATMMAFAMFVDTPPFDDVRVRQALKIVIDREEMVEKILAGYGVAGDDTPVPPTSPFAWRSRVPPRDVEGAIALLDEAGYDASNPLKIDLYTSEFFPGVTHEAELYKEQAAEAGIEINLIVVDSSSEYWNDIWMTQPYVGTYWDARHPSEQLAMAYLSNSTTNETHWQNEDYDALLTKAKATIDDAERTELYKQAAQMLTEEGGIVIPMFTQLVAAMQANCQGYERHVQGNVVDFGEAYCDR